MKKIFIIAILIVNVYIVSLLVSAFSYQSNETKKFTWLNDNVIAAFNDGGYTADQQEQITTLDGVDTVDFQTSIPDSGYQFTYDDSQVDFYSTGKYLPFNLINPDKFQLSSGTLPSNDSELIIADQFADRLIEYQIIDKQVIGEQIDISPNDSKTTNKVTIVGTFDNSDYYKELHELDPDGSTHYIINNAFFTSMSSPQVKPVVDYIIYSNLRIAWAEYNKDVQYISNCTDADCTIDYYASVTNGVRGLINPDDENLYGDEFKNTAYITLDDSKQREEIETKLTREFDFITIVDSNSKMSDFNDGSKRIISGIILAILINLITFIPLYKRIK